MDYPEPSKLVEKLRAHLETEEDKASMKAWFAKWNYDSERGFERMCRMLDHLSKNEIHTWMDKFLEWEAKYEEYWYTERHTQTSSLLFNCLMKYTEKKGKKVKQTKYEDFLAGAHKWKGYTFKLYVGQGSFWRVIKDKEEIFQTT